MYNVFTNVSTVGSRELWVFSGAGVGAAEEKTQGSPAWPVVTLSWEGTCGLHTPNTPTVSLALNGEAPCPLQGSRLYPVPLV